MTQSEQHGIFDGIPYNMFINSINTFYSTVWVPKCSSNFLCEFEELRSNASQKKTQSGKHGIFRGTFRGIILKVLKVIPNCLNGKILAFHEVEDLCPHI